VHRGDVGVRTPADFADRGAFIAALGEHRLTVYLSLNYLAEAQLQVGSRLPLKLVPERIKVFE
jgi:hypothetical protein